jgi:hypothetical protein
VRAEQFARGRGFCGAFARRVVLRLRNAPVAQLDRAAASEAVGQKFESSRAHHTHFSAKERFQLAEKTIVILSRGGIFARSGRDILFAFG